MLAMTPVDVLSPDRTILPTLALNVPTRPVMGATSVYQVS